MRLLTGFAIPAVEGRSGILCFPSSVVSSAGYKKGWSSGDAGGRAGRAGRVGGCALGIWGAAMWTGSTAVGGLQYR